MIQRLLPDWDLYQKYTKDNGMEYRLTDPRAYDKPENKITEGQGVAEGLESLGITGLVDIPVFTPAGVAKVVNTGDRIMAVMNVKGVNIPLYISTGSGGKASVPTGKWYPIFGVDPSSGWLNKGSEASINKFYGSRILALQAARLNNALGDLSSVEDKLPLMKKSGLGIINKDLQPMGYYEVSANPNAFKERINSFLAKLGEGPHYNIDKPKEQGMAEGLFDRFKKKLTANIGGIDLTAYKEGGRIIINASSQGKQLGIVMFNINGKTLVADRLMVQPEYRGQGIAEIMYDWAKGLGYTVQRSSDQTDDGKRFWDKLKGEETNVWEQGVAEDN
jgi:GNAT superfamily N-acetyltransferase